jgi:hypothetical protein
MKKINNFKTIPKASYVIDNHGEKISVQISVKDWKNLISDYKRMRNLLLMKKKLKNAFSEVRQIQNGQKKSQTLSEFLNEL